MGSNPPWGQMTNKYLFLVRDFTEKIVFLKSISGHLASGRVPGWALPVTNYFPGSSLTKT
jgi:hypothetical protein